MLTAVHEDCDGFEDSILVDVPRFGVSVYEFDMPVKKDKTAKADVKSKTEAKSKTSVKSKTTAKSNKVK